MSASVHVRLSLTLWTCPPGSFVHGILQTRILAWVAMPSFRGSSQPRDQTCVFYVSFSACQSIGRWILYHQCQLVSSLCIHLGYQVLPNEFNALVHKCLYTFHLIFWFTDLSLIPFYLSFPFK